MSDSAPNETVAIVGDPARREESVARTILAGDVAAVRWFSPRDVDEVDAAARRGELRRVLFLQLDDLLEAVWQGEIDLIAWRARGVHVTYAEPRDGGAPDFVTVLADNWQRWEARHRRRQIVAGLVLSAIAIAAAFLLNRVC